MDEIPDHVFTADKRQYGKLQLKSRASAMRRAPTEAEQVLWQALRGSKAGAKFRRQHPIDRYIVDFACIAALLVVEADGPTHHAPDQRAYDAGRSALLAERGFRVLRFTNEQVLEDLDAVLNEIKTALQG
ncbi:endonuclease domain-containing protein [Hymenobacter monticola]|uniref:Endonuclease domain-containing protein n=1 Tax=Hymenobacter monticola TaxID=1705399 RepID=A0ABY4AYW8_9BACT|nr:endonuclease domain-containing protein [Hymenobacter monticola]UOE32108.1 endonuclease domain-containing protein [Hymenobacter monticola]